MRQTAAKHGPKSGFTLIELLITLVIIGILAGIAIQQYGKARIHAQAAALSYALHEMEDVMGQALIRGELYANGRPLTDREAIMRRLPEGDRAALDPELPDGLELTFLAATGPGGATSGGPVPPPTDAGSMTGRTMPSSSSSSRGVSTASATAHPGLLINFLDTTSDNRHRALLDKLAEMRPTTARPSGHVIVGEMFDMRDMVAVPNPEVVR